MKFSSMASMGLFQLFYQIDEHRESQSIHPTTLTLTLTLTFTAEVILNYSI